ncbi:MAG: type III pantothenate kinase [Flavipsychrobacter sp.]|nr:type III pantothenate kinase [Flavipsychrobacter sp.]
MATTLCIDWGNTLVKAGIFVNDRLGEVKAFTDEEAMDVLADMIDYHRPTHCILCSVVFNPKGVEDMLCDKIPAYMKLDGQTPLPIMNAYSTDTLGNDRIPLAVAANILYPGMNNLVISVGTCITYNFIQKTGIFRGGAISPGVRMRLKAMHAFTDMLPEVALEGELILLGYDTTTGMRSGAAYGVAAEIDGMITDFSKQYPDFNAVLTGGDAPFFANKVKSKIFADPELLLKGLNLILKHNVPELR